MMHILTDEEYTDLCKRASASQLKLIELFDIMVPVFTAACQKRRKPGKSIGTILEEAKTDMLQSLPNWPS